MDILDVFRNDAFSALSLTSFIDRHPFNPQGLGSLNLFEPIPLRNKAMAVEERNGQLVLIPTSARGGPATERTTEKRKVRYFEAPRLMHGDTLRSDEIQGVREFIGDGGIAQTVLMQMQAEVARRLTGPTGLTSNIEYTWEYHRLGAIQGILLDAGGNVLYNWFNEFGITPATEIGFNLAAGATAATGTLRPLLNNINRTIQRAAKGSWIHGRSKVAAICGDTFYDQLTNHFDVKQTYLNWLAAKELRAGQAFSQFEFGDILFINYRGSDDNSAIALPTDKAKFFPIDAPGVFQVGWGPGESMEWVNQPGKPMYVNMIPDRDRRSWIRSEITSFPLFLCARPDMLMSGRSEA